MYRKNWDISVYEVFQEDVINFCDNVRFLLLQKLDGIKKTDKNSKFQSDNFNKASRHTSVSDRLNIQHISHIKS